MRARASSLAVVVCGMISTAGSAPAAAFSDPSAFARPAVEGGGGGREFTGSPQDGLGCSVCHRGGPAPLLALDWRDLSETDAAHSTIPDVFQPGHDYAVDLRWDAEQASHALQLELVDGNGGAPDMALPPEAQLPASARCDGLAEGPPAVYRHDLGARQVIGVEDCGAAELTFAFTAPDAADLYFGLGMVRSNSDGDPAGDGVLELRRHLRKAGTTTAGCATAGAAPTPWALLPVALWALGAAWRRRGGTPQSNRNDRNSVLSTTETSLRPRKAR